MVIESLKDVVSSLADVLPDDGLLFDVLLDAKMSLSNSLLLLKPEIFIEIISL